MYDDFMLDSPFHIRRLQQEIQIRKEKNPRYSLRAFAKFLGLGPSTLSRILSHQQELSQSACKNIIKKLKFNHDDSVLFISSIAEERKRRAYHDLYSLLENTTEQSPFQTFEWMHAKTPDLMFVFDRHGRIIHGSESVSHFFQIPPERIIGMSMDEIGIHEDISTKIKQCLRSVFENPRIETVEDCYQVDGDSLCFEVTIVPIGRSEKIRAVACHWRDITEKTASERMWKADLQVAETFSQVKDTQEALNIFSEQITEYFCEACVIQMPNNKKISSGPEKLIKIPDSKLLTLNKIQRSERLLSVPVFRDEKKISAVISFIRDKKRNPFTLRDFEFARDLQLKVEALLN